MQLALVEIVFELLFSVVAGVVGLVVAELAYAAWVAVRWLMSSSRGAEVVHGADGAVWSLRRTWRPWPSSWPLSGQLFGARRQRPGAPTRSDRHWLHPKRMTARFDDLIAFVAPIFLALVLVGVAVFIVETIIVMVFASVILGWRLITRRSWRVETTGPDGRTTSRTGLTLDEANRIAHRVRADVESGHPIGAAMADRSLL